MCKGRGVPGSRTTSSGNNGRSVKRSPASAETVPRLYDSTGSYLDLQGRGEYNAIMELDGKVVVVTGASMGIGEAIAKRFAAEGASVVLLSRDTVRAEAARARIGFSERTVALSCDVRHSEEIDRVLGLTLHHFKRIDVWVNNAGHGLLDSVEQVQMAACSELKQVRPTSVKGITPERVANAVLDGYRKKKREVIVPWTMHLPVKLYQAFPALVEWAMGRMAG